MSKLASQRAHRIRRFTVPEIVAAHDKLARLPAIVDPFVIKGFRLERVTPQIVGKWRQGFVKRGLDGLLDQLRAELPRKIDYARVEDVIVQTLEASARNIATCR